MSSVVHLPDHSARIVASPEAVLHMRQVAGLSAGSTMDLHTGSFEFSESGGNVGFTLTINNQNDVVLVPGQAPAFLDEVEVGNATQVGNVVLNVRTACFVLRPPRPSVSGDTRLRQIHATRRAPKLIKVPDFPVGKSAALAADGSWLSALLSDPQNGNAGPQLDAASWEFLEEIRRARSAVAERQRNNHPDPEELQSRLRRLDPGLWDRSFSHPLFGRFAIAYASIPWEPRFDDPDRIPTKLHDPIGKLSCLPWVPVTANLLVGPLGVVGNRSAALACVRFALLSLASLTAPGELEFSVTTQTGNATDWAWTAALPAEMSPTGKAKYCVAIADGMENFESAGLDEQAVKDNELGLIVLGETIDDLPPYCGTVLTINDDGTCHVTNHLGQRIEGTPIGITHDYATQLAKRLGDVLSAPKALTETSGASQPKEANGSVVSGDGICLLYTSPSPRDATLSRMPSSA